MFFDALRVRVREDAVVRNKAVYLALGVRADGTREMLGLWIESESPRILRRLQLLREWSHEETRRSFPPKSASAPCAWCRNAVAIIRRSGPPLSR